MISTRAAKFIPNDKLENRFEVLKGLRQSDAIVVYQAKEYANNYQYVIFETRISSDKGILSLERAMGELSKINHPHLLRIILWSYLIEISGKKQGYKIWFLYEFFKENLADLIASRAKTTSHIGAGQLYAFMSGCLGLFHYLKANSIPHKPIKPSNFFTTNEGFAKFDGISANHVNDLWENSFTVDKKYLAPELKDKTTGSNPIGDVFSLGLVFLELASLKLIEGSKDLEKNIKTHLKDIEEYYPRELISIIKSMLTIDPTGRPPFGELDLKLRGYNASKFTNFVKGKVTFDTRIAEEEESKDSGSSELVISEETLKFRQTVFFSEIKNEFFGFSLVNLAHIVTQNQPLSSYIIPKGQRALNLSNGRIFMVGGNEKGVNFHEYDTSRRKVIDLKAMNEKSRLYPSLCATKTHIYVGGGQALSGEQLSSFEAYEIESNTWKKLAPLSQPAIDFALCAVNDAWIYKIGGRSNDTILNSIEKYSIDDNLWIPVTPKYSSRVTGFKFLAGSHAVQINKNEIFIFGGYDEIGSKNSTFVLNFKYKDEEQILHINSNAPKDKEVLRGTLIPTQALCHKDEIYFLKESGPMLCLMSYSAKNGWEEVKMLPIK